MIGIDEIVKYQNDPRKFIEDFCLKAPLRRHQHHIIDFYQNEKINFFIKCRQLGFTTISLGFAYWISLFKRDANIVFIVSDVGNSGRHFLQQITTWHLKNTNKFFSKIKINSFGKKIIFDNGSTIQMVPYSIDAVHGAMTDLLVMDEFAYCEDLKNKWKAYYPSAIQGKIFAHSSLPTNQSKSLIDFCEEINSTDNINSQVFNWLIDETKNYQWYKEQVKLIGKNAAEAELNCKFKIYLRKI